MKLDLHMHSVYSKHKFWGLDSYSTPENIVKVALKKGLDGVAVTDHNEVKGSLVTQKVAKKINTDFVVIPSAEISTEKGHVLAFGIQENIDGLSITWEEVVDKIRQQGGLAVVSHPFCEFFCGLVKKTKWVAADMKKFDGIEGFNAGNRTGNKMAQQLAKKFGKGMTAGSDAHTLSSIGYAGVECEDLLKDLKKGKTKIWGDYKPLKLYAENIWIKARNMI